MSIHIYTEIHKNQDEIVENREIFSERGQTVRNVCIFLGLLAFFLFLYIHEFYFMTVILFLGILIFLAHSISNGSIWSSFDRIERFYIDRIGKRQFR